MHVDIDGIDDAIGRLNRLDAAVLAPKMLNAAASTAVQALKASIRRYADRGYSRHDLESSIEATAAARNNYGCFIAVRPTGTDRKGVRNGEKLAYLQYGVSGKQEARPVLDSAASSAEEKVIKIMEDVLEREAGAL